MRAWSPVQSLPGTVHGLIEKVHDLILALYLSSPMYGLALELLHELELNGAVVTLDAMGRQHR
jgi:hypothetical protein